jgi:hypothetical protein
MFERSAGNALGKGGRMVPGEGTHTHTTERARRWTRCKCKGRCKYKCRYKYNHKQKLQHADDGRVVGDEDGANGRDVAWQMGFFFYGNIFN